MEHFIQIEDYPDYEVSNLGRVISTKFGKRRELKQANRFKEYKGVALMMDGSRKAMYVHRLVYEAFIGSIPEDLEINHIDMDKGNNSLDNLEVVSHAENVVHSFENSMRGQLFTDDEVRELRRQYKEEGLTTTELGRAVGVEQSIMWRIVKGGGYKWVS